MSVRRSIRRWAWFAGAKERIFADMARGCGAGAPCPSPRRGEGWGEGRGLAETFVEDRFVCNEFPCARHARLGARLAQDRVGSGAVEEQVRQHVVEQVGLPFEALLAAGAVAAGEDHAARFAAVDLR